MLNDLYLRCVCGCDDPSAVSIVVILDRVVWGCDDATHSSQLTSAHRCCKGSKRWKEVKSLIHDKTQRMKYQPFSWIGYLINNPQCFLETSYAFQPPQPPSVKGFLLFILAIVFWPCVFCITDFFPAFCSKSPCRVLQLLTQLLTL